MPTPPKSPDNSLPHAIGQFVGHIWKGVRTDTSSSGSSERVGKRTQEHRTVDADGRQITLRRTIIDEIEITPDHATPGDEPHGAS